MTTSLNNGTKEQFITGYIGIIKLWIRALSINQEKTITLILKLVY